MTTPTTATEPSLRTPAPGAGLFAGSDRRAALLHAVGLCLVLLAGAGLRLIGLRSQGLVYWDEAKFALEGVRMHALLSSLATGSHLVTAGKAVGTAKPSHALFIGLAYLVAGVHDCVPLYLDALASLAAIMVVYLLGRRLFSPGVGLVASALLAVTMYDVVYARSALSESDANAALLAGLLIWSYARRVDGVKAIPGRTALILVAGVILGFALTINYRIAPSIGAILLFDLVWTLLLRRRLVVPRLLCWLAGVAVAPATWQIVGAASAHRGTVLFRSEVTLRPETYLGQLLGRFQVGLGAGPAGSFQWTTVLERVGPVMVALVLLSVVLALRMRSSSWILVLLLVVVPLAGALSASFAVTRSLAVAIPFAALAVAASLDLMARWSTSARRLALALTAVAIVAGGAVSWQLMGERSGLARAVAYVRGHGADRALTSSEVPVFYFNGPGVGCRAPRPSTLDALIADVRVGYGYAILDYHSSGFMDRIIRDHGRLVARYPVVTGNGPVTDLVASEDAQHPAPVETESIDVIEIDHLHASTAATKPDSCVPDRPG